MPKKNPPPPRRRKYCLGNQKDLDGIGQTLREMMSSEEEEDDDEDESLMNKRLDDIQNTDMDCDLLAILSDNLQYTNYETNEEPFVTVPDTHLLASPPVDDQISAQNIHLPSSPPSYGQIAAQDIHLPASPPIDDQVSAQNIHLPASPPIDDQVSAQDFHLPATSPVARLQVASSSRSSRIRPSYAQVQNRTWEWITDIEDFNSLTFEKPMQVIKAYNNRSQPKDYFMDMCPNEAIDLIVKNTNIYAQVTNSKNWIAVTEEEICAYLGMIILMSINPLTDYQLYWSSDPFYNNPVISRVMPLKRFKKINENLHISNITEELPRTSPNYNKLCKVQPFIDILNVVFEGACEQSDTQSIDESMIRFKGRSSMKQYMPKKPIKRGYKCWARCDSKTGYLYQFQFYTGKIGNTIEENLGYRVVLDLSETVPRNTLLAFDNFFTSLGLLTALHQRELYAVATMSFKRKGLPKNLTSRNKETHLNPGEFMYWYSRPVSLVKWKDSKDVFVASTAHSPREATVITRKQKDGSKKQMFCPIAIKRYTQYMGGVDLFDHYRSSYPLGRKSRKSWHRLFWFLFDAAIINAYIVYMQGHSERRNTHRDFRLRLGRAMINNYSSRIKTAPVFKMKKGGLGVPDEVRLTNVGSHMPKIEKFRRCRHCSTREKEKRSKYVCSTCKVPLCAAPCFEQYHSIQF